MIDLKSRPHSLVDNWRSIRGLLGAFGSPALDAFREENFRRFREQGLPNSKDEEFKYVSFREVEEGAFEPAYGATVVREELGAAALPDMDAVTLTFVNGQYAPELSTVDALPTAAYIGPVTGDHEDAEMLRMYLGKVSSLDGKLGSSNDQRFVYLANAYVGEIAMVVLSKGAVMERPIHIVYVSKADHKPFAAFPRTLVVLHDGAQAKVVETYLGLEGTYLTNAVTEIVLGEGAILEHTLVQQETDGASHLKTVAVDQAAGSVYTSNNVNFGGRLARTEVNVFVAGEHAETWLNGANVGTGHQVLDNHTRIDHAKPNCNSFEVYKSILRDRATGVFNGKIFVYQDAQKTDAKQTNQGILLSPTATFDTKPQLEIFADDVKCTHGATVGQLREDALFYLRARGIPRKEAQAMLVYAFAAEVLEKITIDPLRDRLEKVLFDKLNETEALPA